MELIFKLYFKKIKNRFFRAKIINKKNLLLKMSFDKFLFPFSILYFITHHE